MAKKQKTLIVPTGDYSIKMPTVVSITAENVPVVHNNKEIKQDGLIDIWWWFRFALRVTLILLLFLCVLLLLYFKRPDFVTYDYLVSKLRPQQQEASPNVRYVLDPQIFLYEAPPESVYFYSMPKYLLRSGDPVELVGEMHESPSGKIWIKVRYQHIAGSVREVREGWVDVRELSGQLRERNQPEIPPATNR